MLRIVATDGHRLACVESPLPQGAENMQGVILPRKTVGEIRKLLDDTDAEEIRISLSDSKVRFVLEDITLASKLIDGTYPDYERVIPTSNDKILELLWLKKINNKMFTICYLLTSMLNASAETPKTLANANNSKS